MIESRSDGLLKRDPARPRRDWVAAYRAWIQVADDKALSSSDLTDEQRAALRRDRAAETAYLAHPVRRQTVCLRMIRDSRHGAIPVWVRATARVASLARHCHPRWHVRTLV